MRKPVMNDEYLLRQTVEQLRREASEYGEDQDKRGLIERTEKALQVFNAQISNEVNPDGDSTGNNTSVTYNIPEMPYNVVVDLTDFEVEIYDTNEDEYVPLA